MGEATLRSRTSRRLTATLATLGLVAGSLVGFAATAGATTIIRDTITTPFTETGIVDDCGRQGITGTLVGTDVVTFQAVETSVGFHVYGTETATGQITWTDGSYTIIESADHLSFNTGEGTTVQTVAHVDSGDTYSADGVFLFRVTFHLREHFTITDGVVRVDFVEGQFHFFDDCPST